MSDFVEFDEMTAAPRNVDTRANDDGVDLFVYLHVLVFFVIIIIAVIFV